MGTRLILAALIGLVVIGLVSVGLTATLPFATGSSSAASDVVTVPPVLAPHGAPPTIYEGPGGRALLSGLWRFKRDPNNSGLDKGYDLGIFSGDLVRIPFVPDATKITGDAGVRNFRGTIGWYRTNFRVAATGTYAIGFESVNHEAEVWIDGKKVGSHVGEYLPFEVRANLAADVKHTLVVRADWRNPSAMKREGWHRLWFNFGGINRGVTIRQIGDSELLYPALQTTLAPDGSATVTVNVHLRNNAATRTITPTGTLVNGSQSVPLTFVPTQINQGQTQVLTATASVPKPALWSPSTPAEYDMQLQVPGEATYQARVGLREVKAVGTQLMLNGRPIRMHGASIHEDAFGHGDALTPADQDGIVADLQAIHANATRSQHPIDPGLLERLDAAGIMVWQGVGPTDSPGNWTSKGPARLKTAETRVRTTVRQDQLHPSIITWNLANEVAGDGHPGGQVEYVDTMAQELHRTDPGRPVALDVWGAHPPHHTSVMYSHIDMIGWTNYIGWYESTFAPADQIASQIKSRLAQIRSVFPDKVIAVTEFGAEANGQNLSTAPGGFAFQAHLLDIHLGTYESIPDIAGELVWNLRDFAVSPSFAGGSITRQVPNIKLVRGLNQKGLFDEHGQPKASVDVVAGHFAAEAASAAATVPAAGG